MTDNVYAVYALGHQAASWQVRKFVFTSTAAIYQPSARNVAVDENRPAEPRGLYALTKYLAEITLKTFDFPSITLRYPYLYGKYDRNSSLAKIIKDMKDNKTVVVRDESRDYLCVEEAVDVVLKAMQYRGPHTVFNAGSGVLVSMLMITRQIAALLGYDIGKVGMEGKRNNAALDSTLAGQEMGWISAKRITEELDTLLRLY